MARRTSLGLAHQAFAIRNRFPDSRPVLTRGRLAWKWSLQPSEVSRTYDVLLLGREGEQASVFVETPELEANDDGLLPHVYDDGALCLNRRGEWLPRMLYVDTFIPWASQWLFFYELWRATGLWHGDGPEALNTESQSALLHPYSGPKGVKSW